MTKFSPENSGGVPPQEKQKASEFSLLQERIGQIDTYLQEVEQHNQECLTELEKTEKEIVEETARLGELQSDLSASQASIRIAEESLVELQKHKAFIERSLGHLQSFKTMFEQQREALEKLDEVERAIFENLKPRTRH